jgi:hypothetical protein
VRYQYTSLERSTVNTELFEYAQYTQIGCEEEEGAGPSPPDSSPPLANSTSREVMRDIRRQVMSAAKLYPPGALVHIIDRDEWNRISSDREAGEGEGEGGMIVVSQDECLVAYLADQMTFNELQLSGSMFSAHLPTECLNKLRTLFPMSS